MSPTQNYCEHFSVTQSFVYIFFFFLNDTERGGRGKNITFDDTSEGDQEGHSARDKNLNSHDKFSSYLTPEVRIACKISAFQCY